MKKKIGILIIVIIIAICVVIGIIFINRNKNTYDNYSDREYVDILNESTKLSYEETYLPQLVAGKDSLVSLGVPESFFDDPYISYTTDTGLVSFINNNDGSITMIIVTVDDGNITDVTVTTTGA